MKLQYEVFFIFLCKKFQVCCSVLGFQREGQFWPGLPLAQDNFLFFFLLTLSFLFQFHPFLMNLSLFFNNSQLFFSLKVKIRTRSVIPFSQYLQLPGHNLQPTYTRKDFLNSSTYLIYFKFMKIEFYGLHALSIDLILSLYLLPRVTVI